ncbi:MAG: TIGR03619 family F420-dependent LLM class oxidoreductase [Ilumatobacteraceae bacterium]
MQPPRSSIRLICVLTENWTLVEPDDLRGLIDVACLAERCGIDTVMMSEHLVLGPSANALGEPSNPRAYAAPGNQNPATASWPSSLAMLAAIGARTSTLRLAASALIAPLRHPLQLAQELATIDRMSGGRLVVQPTVSWHRDEYEALGVPFHRRGELLDEHLAAWRRVWTGSPARFEGTHYRFDDVYLHPKPVRPTGVPMWFGGESMHPAIVRRMVEYGSGFNPFGPATADDLALLEAGLVAAGRSLADIELIGGTRAVFEGSNDVADVDRAIAHFPDAIAAGYRSFCFKPSQHTDDVRDLEQLFRHLVDRCNGFAPAAA